MRRLRRGLAQPAMELHDWLHDTLKELVDKVPPDSQKVSSYFRPQLEAALNRVVTMRALLEVSKPETPHMMRARELLAFPVDTSLERSKQNGGYPNPTRARKRC